MKLILNESTSSAKADGINDSFNVVYRIGLVRGVVVPELQRAINVQGRALLKRFNLPDPLVEQMVGSKTVSCLVST